PETNSVNLTWGRKASANQAKLDGWLEREAAKLRAEGATLRKQLWTAGEVDAFAERRKQKALAI
ncbi:hypothetical protein, partial [Shewanella marisflavi]|uniref:hypothetical protein n=1 Tax=Shewanella marisflavi TaxID=260364 RepID=UPI003AAFA3B3